MSESVRNVSFSRVTMTELVLPEDTNVHGSMFGGRVLAMADKCAAIVAMRHSGLPVVTASIDRVDFLKPVRLGMVIVLIAELNASFGSSMEVGVTVEAEDPLTNQRVKTCRALLTLVALDSFRHPAAVPPLVLETEEERQRAARAAERRRLRLQSRGEF